MNAANLLNERSILSMNQWQGVQLFAVAEKTIQIRIVKH